MVVLDKHFQLTIIIIGASIISGIYVFNYRFDEGYQYGILDGFDDGNQTGYSDGILEGNNEGTEQGMANGWRLGEKLGYEEGLEFGYTTGYQDGVDFGYLNGYNNGSEMGSSIGYLAGVIEGSKNCDIRDPIYSEVVSFILSDETDKLVSNGDTSFYISEFRESAYWFGYRCIWVEVEIENNGCYYFCGFNTTDNGLIIVDCMSDELIDVEIGESSYNLGYEGKIIDINLIP